MRYRCLAEMPIDVGIGFECLLRMDKAHERGADAVSQARSKEAEVMARLNMASGFTQNPFIGTG